MTEILCRLRYDVTIVKDTGFIKMPLAHDAELPCKKANIICLRYRVTTKIAARVSAATRSTRASSDDMLPLPSRPLRGADAATLRDAHATYVELPRLGQPFLARAKRHRARLAL